MLDHGSDTPTYSVLNTGVTYRYYHRSHRKNDETVTYTLDPVPPRDLLAEIAENISSLQPGTLRGELSLDVRIAATGETTTTREDLNDDQLGKVYLRNENYYTVVVTDRTTLDRPLLSKITRAVVTITGVFVLLFTIGHARMST